MQNELDACVKEITEKINKSGSTIPHHRAAFKAGHSFSKLPFEDQLDIWDHAWKHAEEWRIRLHAFLFLEQYMKDLKHLPLIWATSVSWQDEANSWDLCDSLSKINTRALELIPDKVYKQLAKWNKDKNLFKRRQSVVSLLYYSRTKKVFLPFEQIAALVEPLLTDKEYYVQKGVGWTLREMGNVYPKETMSFLETHLQLVSAMAFTIAIEKMNMQEKGCLKALRKK